MEVRFLSSEAGLQSNHFMHAPGVNAACDGVLLVGHGTRDADGVSEFLAVADRLAQRGNRLVEPCFLELAQPTIAEGFDRLVDRGARRIAVMPLLLFAAGHAKHDVPAAVAQAAADFPEIVVRQVPHLGCHDAVLRLSAQRYFEAVAEHEDVAPRDTWLILVGRGSQDAQATREMHALADLRAAHAPVARVEVCFIAMAEPDLSSVLERAGLQGPRRVVVQPHLLFAGRLLDALRDSVARFASRYPRSQWLMTQHLGPSDLLVQAILERVALADFNPPASQTVSTSSSR